MNPKVSIIVPTHNRADMLGEALDSVLRQTYTDWELIVVDDGSVDDTRTFVSKYTEADPRIRYIYQANKGLPGARNTGIRMALGDYIAFLDSDDLFLPHKLQSQVAVLDQSPTVGLVASGHVEVDQQLQVLRKVRPWLAQPGLDLLSWVSGCPFIVNAVLVRRCWLEQVNFFDEGMRYVEDWDLWLRLAQAGCTMAWHHDIVCYYRFHISNMARHAQLMQTGMLRLLDKLYAQSNLPQTVWARRDKAYANVYLDTSGRAFAAGDGALGKAWLARAIELDPTLTQGQPPQVLATLASFALMPLCEDPEKFMDIVVRHLPDNAAAAKNWSGSQANSLVHAVAAFQSAQTGESAQTTHHALLAFWRDPSWLRNRGLVAITLRAFLKHK